jgi:hypothetical protein
VNKYSRSIMPNSTRCRTVRTAHSKITAQAVEADSFTAFFHELPPHKRGVMRQNLLFVGMALGVYALLTLSSKVHAAGGPYVVDDGAINAPGECNVDVWYKSQRHQQSNHETEVSQDCTFKALPSVQFGATVSRSHDDGDRETQVSPKVKAQVFSDDDLGLEVALAAGANFALNRRHSFDGADLTLPMTYQPFEPLRLNVSTGWSHAYDDGKQSHSWTWGAGVEYALAESLTLIAERFGHLGGGQGWQAGPRLHLGKQFDVDLVVGRHLNNDREQWLATGATLRF